MFFPITNLNNYRLETLRNIILVKILVSMERECHLFLCYFSLLGDDITEKWQQTKTEGHFVCRIFIHPSLLSEYNTILDENVVFSHPVDPVSVSGGLHL